jgi:hypothetical protein
VKVGDLTFDYVFLIHTPIDDKNWFWTYTDATLSSGEKVGQIAVEYFFNDDPDDSHPPSIRVFFETADGDVHKVSDSTISLLKSGGHLKDL